MKKTHAKLKKELDAVFSKYIRNYFADDNSIVECYTCYVKKPIKEMHNGHFISRRHLSTRWHEDNCRPQCPRCNLFAQGETLKFYRRLTAEIGEEKVVELEQKSNTLQKFSKIELQEMIGHYKNKLKKL